MVDNSIMSFHLRAEWRALRVTLQKNLEGAMELRTGFLLQICGMMMNNMAFLVGWIFFFKIFGTINHWSIAETIGLQGMVALVYGVSFTFASGAATLPDYVHQGVFDQFLLAPRNLYLRILSSKLRVSAIGDCFFGIALLVIYSVKASLSLEQIAMLFLFLPPTILLFCNISLLTSLLAFFIPDSSILSRNLFEAFFAPSMYPSSLYGGWIRTVFLYVIPSLVIGGLPVEAIRDQKTSLLLLVWAISLGWMILTLFLLNRAIRRYESGNLTGARVM